MTPHVVAAQEALHTGPAGARALLEAYETIQAMAGSLIPKLAELAEA